MQTEEERYRSLKRTHQQLLREWKRKAGSCIICGEREANDKDHLPPEVLFPSLLRTPFTELFTYPVCKECNNSSSGEDFLFSVALSFGLNQESILKEEEPADPDLLALYRQTRCHMNDPKESSRRFKLLQSFIGKDPVTGKQGINLERLPINQTLTKIVKAVYWHHTSGDILQHYNPGWWIRTAVDTSKPNFIEKHLKVSQANLHWGDRFITHFTLYRQEDGCGWLIFSSLHFYTNRQTGKGMSWIVGASPSKTLIGGGSLYEQSRAIWGDPTIEPEKQHSIGQPSTTPNPHSPSAQGDGGR